MPRFGAGKPKAHPEVYEISALTQEDLDNFVPAETAKEIGTTLRMRDSHHRIAHLFAMGLRNAEILEITGYSAARLSTLRASPAMGNLVELYRKDVVEVRQTQVDHKFSTINRLHVLAASEMIDRFEDDEDRAKISNGHLVSIISDTADRIGYPKRRENVNFNQDFASRLDRAVARADKAKTIEGEVVSAPAEPAQVEFGVGEGESRTPNPLALPTPYRRKVG